MRAKRRNVCQICRSRKLACDGKQPACSQCLLRKISGCIYQQEFTFVYQGSSRILKHAGIKEGNEVIRRTKEETPSIFHDQQIWYIRSSGLNLLNGLGRHLEVRGDYGVESNIKCILQSYTPVKSPTPVEFEPLHNQICGAWIGVLPLLSATKRRAPFLVSAISTLATTLRHHTVRHKSYQSPLPKMYFDSLRHIGKAIDEARGVFQIEHCVAIMCLAVTHILTPILGSGWITHARGIGDLMEHLRPEIFSSGMFHSLFVGFRPLLIISSILSRQSALLAKEEWTTIPFRGQSISIMQQLLNRASVLPSLLERYYNTKGLLEIANLVLIERLCQDFKDFLRSLQEWEITSESRAQFPLVWSRPNIGNTLPSVANILWFPNIMTANSLTHYWAFKIIAKTHLSTLEDAIATSESHPSLVASESDIGESVADLAEMICNSMPYLIQPEMELQHAGSSFFTLPTAIRVFQKDSSRYNVQLLRCRQIVDQLESIGIYFIRI